MKRFQNTMAVFSNALTQPHQITDRSSQLP
jgi:hypothetical protein